MNNEQDNPTSEGVPVDAVEPSTIEPTPAEVVSDDATEEVTVELSRPEVDVAASESSAAKGNPRYELRQLMELVVKYPEIGPPLAELAFKIGHADIGDRIVRMGVADEDTTGVEYYAVATDVARRAGNYDEVFSQVIEALQAVAAADADAVTADDLNRLLHVLRTAFAVLLFDIADVNAKPEWVAQVTTQLPALASRYADDPFYHSLLAQTLWFTDKAASEAAWETAVSLADGEFAWNARGTWYKDAEKDFEAAKQAYRTGLKKLPNSALLLHNLAQLFTDEAEKTWKEEADQARLWLREADRLTRTALKKDTRKGLRHHIHRTKDRAARLLKKLPPEVVPPPNVGDTLKGRVAAVVSYGCFITIAGGYKGLLHVSELAWERVEDPSELVKVDDEFQVKVVSVETQDDGTVRVGFSRKALLKQPENLPAEEKAPRGRGRGRGRGRDASNNEQQAQQPKSEGGRGRGRGRGGRGRGDGNDGAKGKGGGTARSHRDDPRRADGMGSLGELLLSKLEEAKSDD